MNLEEYILKRKKEDGINEYDFEKRLENTRICANYVFEFFNNYLDTKPTDEKTLLQEHKIEKYRKIINGYNPEVKEWLVNIYSSYGKYMHKKLINMIDDTYFLLYDSDAEFRALSYDIYYKAIKQLKFLEGQSEMIFSFLKEAHRVNNMFPYYEQNIYISDKINEWINETYKKHGVNIYNFCNEWVEYFGNRPEMWPKGHKQKSEHYAKRAEYDRLGISNYMCWKYDYKQKDNLFGLDALYKNMPKKVFTIDKKQEFEAVLMYCWLHGITSDAEYWDKYIENVS